MLPPPDDRPTRRHGLASARSPELLVVLAMLFAIEGLAVHLLVSHWWPHVAWVLTLASLGALGAIVADYRAFGRSAIGAAGDTIALDVGLRLHATFRRDAIVQARSPAPGELSRLRGRYLNVTKPTTPNLLLEFREPISMLLLGLVPKRVSLLALHVDDASEAVADLDPA